MGADDPTTMRRPSGSSCRDIRLPFRNWSPSRWEKASADTWMNIASSVSSSPNRSRNPRSNETTLNAVPGGMQTAAGPSWRRGRNQGLSCRQFMPGAMSRRYSRPGMSAALTKPMHPEDKRYGDERSTPRERGGLETGTRSNRTLFPLFSALLKLLNLIDCPQRPREATRPRGRGA